MNISSATRQETPDGLQANDAKKITPDDANELSTDEGDRQYEFFCGEST